MALSQNGKSFFPININYYTLSSLAHFPLSVTTRITEGLRKTHENNRKRTLEREAFTYMEMLNFKHSFIQRYPILSMYWRENFLFLYFWETTIRKNIKDKLVKGFLSTEKGCLVSFSFYQNFHLIAGESLFYQ